MGENLRLPVEILHFISPQKISVRVSHENVLPKYYQLQADIQQFCFYEQKEILKTIDPIEGSCLVKHGSFYYRGLVLSSSVTPVRKLFLLVKRRRLHKYFCRKSVSGLWTLEQKSSSIL